MPTPEDITGKMDQLRNKSLPDRVPSAVKPKKDRLRPRPMAFDAFFIGVWVVTLSAIVGQFLFPLLLNR